MAVFFQMLAGHDAVIMHSCLLRNGEQAVFSRDTETEEPDGHVLVTGGISVSESAGSLAADALLTRVTAKGSVTGTARYPGFARPFTGKSAFEYNRSTTSSRIDYVGDILREKLKTDLTG